MSFFKGKEKGSLPGLSILYLVISIVILCLLVLNFEVNFIWLRNFSNKLKNQSTEYQIVQARRIAEMMESSVNTHIENINNLAYNLAVVNLSNRELNVLVNNFLKNNNHVREISVINLEGKETNRISRELIYKENDLRDFGFLEQFEKAKLGNIFVSYVNYTENAEPYVTISLPIKLTGEDMPKAVLVANYYLRGMWEIALETKVGETGRISVFDDKGMLVADPRPSRVLKKLNLLNLPPTKPVLKGNFFNGEKYLNENSVEVFGVGIPLRVANMRWGVIVEENVAEIEASQIEVSKWVAIILTGNIIIIGILVLLLMVLRRANHEVISSYYISESEKQKAITEKNKTVSIISNFVDPIIVLDAKWRILLFNQAAQTAFFLSDSDIGREVAVRDGNFTFESFRNVINKIDYQVKIVEKDAQGRPLVEEAIIKLGTEKTNKLSVFNASGVSINENDLVYKVLTADVGNLDEEPIGHMKIFYDLTREKMVDKLKSEFVSIAAHQLRTPLSSTKWVLKMVLDQDAGPINDEQAGLLAKGYKSNERVINLVNDLLNVTRMEEGKFGFNLEKLDIGEILDNVIEKIKEDLKKKEIKFNWLRPSGLPLLNIDKEKMIMALENVIDNALHYTPQNGTIGIDVSCNNKIITLKIKDNGVGIPESEKERLFTKFYRGINVVKLETEGNGLGLYITKNIIKTHGGSIRVESEEGRGTEVIIELPTNYKIKK